MSLTIKDKEFETFISGEELSQIVADLAREINAHYAGKEVVFLGVLNGAFMFASDLLKEIDLNCEISFVKVASYQGTSSTGKVHELIGLVSDLRNKHVVILEDIVDTGLTLQKIYSMIDHDHPDSLEVATLLFKPSAFKGTHKPKFIGKEIDDEFVLGYGLDYEGKGRNTSSIYKLKK